MDIPGAALEAKHGMYCDLFGIGSGCGSCEKEKGYVCFGVFFFYFSLIHGTGGRGCLQKKEAVWEAKTFR